MSNTNREPERGALDALVTDYLESNMRMNNPPFDRREVAILRDFAAYAEQQPVCKDCSNTECNAYGCLSGNKQPMPQPAAPLSDERLEEIRQSHLGDMEGDWRDRIKDDLLAEVQRLLNKEFPDART